MNDDIQLIQEDINALEKMPKSYGFEQVSIYQNFNENTSRLDVNITSEFVRGLKLQVPVIASNMSSVVNADFCIKLRSLGALGIMHRAFSNEEDYLNEVRKIAKNSDLTAVSIGVDSNSFSLAEKLIKNGANIITIDIAHGFCSALIELSKKIKEHYPFIKLIVGNTINPNMIPQINDFADACKVGIGQGFACTTKNTAGATMKQFSAVRQFKSIAKKYGMPIISDGGVREYADVVKAIGAGANSVMIGSLFAACPESAAKTITLGNSQKKVYFGMASLEAQQEWKGGLKKGTVAEGKTVHLDIGQPIEELIAALDGSIRSGITYGGGRNISEFQNKVQFIQL